MLLFSPALFRFDFGLILSHQSMRPGLPSPVEKTMAYAINNQNRIDFLPARPTVGGVSPTFSSEAQLANLAAAWPAKRLAQVWNDLPGVKPVNRFASRTIGVRRIWRALEQSGPRLGRSSARAIIGKTGRSSRSESKAEMVVRLLRRTSGVSVPEIMAATGWQPHTVRGFISGHLRKRRGLEIRSFLRKETRVYAIAAASSPRAASLAGSKSTRTSRKN